jgi:NTE family protein
MMMTPRQERSVVKSRDSRTAGALRALVFSGGGVFGAYQAGAWRALAESGWRPELVVGTSIGAVNAFVISRCDDPEELIRFWRELPAWASASASHWRLPWRRAALLEAAVNEIARRLDGRPQLRALRITLTSFPTCSIDAVDDEGVTARHLLATCALPAVRPPVGIRGRFYMDGGLFCRLPLQQALEAGASEIVAVDAMAVHPSRPLRRLVRMSVVLRNTLRRERTEPAAPELAGVELRRIAPAEALGKLWQSLAWDREFVDQLIERGYREARASLPSTRAEIAGV